MEEKISTRQMEYIMIINKIGSVITNMSIIHMGPANQDIWIMMILSLFYTLLFSIPLLFLNTRFNNLCIVGFMEKIFGKYIGKIIGLLYGLFFLRIAILYYCIELQMIRTAFMEALSTIIIILIMTIVFIYISTRGLGVLAKSAEFFGPIAITFIVIFILLGINNMDFTILLPIYEDSTFLSLNMGAIEASLILTEAPLLAMNYQNLSNKEDLKKLVIKSKVLSKIIIILMLVATQVSLGIEQARHSNFPFLIYVRIVRTYSVFERIEAVFLISWLMIIMTRVISYIYISSKTFKEVYNQKDINIFIYVVSIIISIFAYYYVEIDPKFYNIYDLDIEIIYYYFIFNLLIPIIAVIVYFFKRKYFKKEERLGN